MKIEAIAFKTEHAERFGIEAAILLQGIQLGLILNKSKRSHNKKGKVWMYNSIREWHEVYPFMSESTIKRALKKLKDEEIIEVMQLDSNPMNKTNWYTLTNALGQNDLMEQVTLNQSKQFKTNNLKQTDSRMVKPTIEDLKKEFTGKVFTYLGGCASGGQIDTSGLNFELKLLSPEGETPYLRFVAKTLNYLTMSLLTG